MPASDLTMNPIKRLEVLWLFQQLVDNRVMRINFYWNSYDNYNLGNKYKIYCICSFYINLNLKHSASCLFSFIIMKAIMCLDICACGPFLITD